MEAYREGQADLRRYIRAIARAQERMRAGSGAASTPCYAGACLGRDTELHALQQWFETPDACARFENEQARCVLPIPDLPISVSSGAFGVRNHSSIARSSASRPRHTSA